MQLTEAIPKLSRNDRRLITRDPFLIIMSGYVVLIALLARYGVPWFTDWLINATGVDLTPYYPLLTSLLILFPQFTGVVFGFLLLDERDQHTLDAMMVTPLPLRVFLIYRVSAAILMAFLLALVTLAIYNPSGLTLLQSVVVCAFGCCVLGRVHALPRLDCGEQSGRVRAGEDIRHVGHDSAGGFLHPGAVAVPARLLPVLLDLARRYGWRVRAEAAGGSMR